jgi:hypothetical protein
MTPRTKRALAIAGGLTALVITTALVLNAFNSNMVFFFSPSQVVGDEAPRERAFRIGGMVEEGSLQRDEKSLTVSFVVTVLMPSDRHAISSSRIASQARPIGSALSLVVTQFANSTSASTR